MRCCLRLPRLCRVSPWSRAMARPRSSGRSCGLVPTRNCRSGLSTTPASRLSFLPASNMQIAAAPHRSGARDVGPVACAQYVRAVQRRASPGRPRQKADRAVSPATVAQRPEQVLRRRRSARSPGSIRVRRLMHRCGLAGSSASMRVAQQQQRVGFFGMSSEQHLVIASLDWRAGSPSSPCPPRLTAAASESCRQNRCSKSAARPLPSRSGNH